MSDRKKKKDWNPHKNTMCEDRTALCTSDCFFHFPKVVNVTARRHRKSKTQRVTEAGCVKVSLKPVEVMRQNLFSQFPSQLSSTSSSSSYPSANTTWKLSFSFLSKKRKCHMHQTMASCCLVRYGMAEEEYIYNFSQSGLKIRLSRLKVPYFTHFQVFIFHPGTQRKSLAWLFVQTTL